MSKPNIYYTIYSLNSHEFLSRVWAEEEKIKYGITMWDSLTYAKRFSSHKKAIDYLKSKDWNNSIVKIEEIINYERN